MNKQIILLITVILIIGAVLFIESKKPEISNEKPVIAENIMDIAEKSGMYPTAKEITTPDGFINTDGITVSELIGKKVILVDFWTYSCINCQRTIPYINTWYDKYSDKGLEILGIHTPEFDFEKDYDNVLAAVKKFGIKYPVILDNDYSTWRAYENRYWPRKYLIDIDGFIVYDHIGEGGYEETEKKIQELLAERAEKLGTGEVIMGGVSNPEGAVDITKRQVGSPEVYFGSSRNELLENGIAGKPGVQDFSDQLEYLLNKLYLVGRWNIESEFASSQCKGEDCQAGVIFTYKASDVHAVMSSADSSALVRVLRDGEDVPEDLAGVDIIYKNGKSYVEVSDETLYNLVSGDNPLENHVIELITEEPKLVMFTFTFG